MAKERDWVIFFNLPNGSNETIYIIKTLKKALPVEEIIKPVEKMKKLLENFRDRYLKDTETFLGSCISVTFLVDGEAKTLYGFWGLGG
jgi:hypothetical protein